jgi:D-alanyl-D-alanine carboxypeptidase/D-alanyl-D-alanine-endopeptidase (penicillin-binding protein 4)
VQVRIRPVIAFVLLAAVPAAGAGLAAQQTATASVTLQEQLNQWFYRASRAAPGEWGVAVADQTGRILWGVNATRPLVPASTVKLFTTGFARTVLGGNARQVTRVLGTGFVDDSGSWIGTWSLELNGDPTLERPARSGPMLRDLAVQLAERGIRRLTGPLTVHSTAGEADAWYPSAWHQRHRGRMFAPLIGALTVNENVVSFTLVPGTRIGAAPRVESSLPDGLAALVDIQARTVDGNQNRLVITALPGGRYRVTGTVGLRARNRVYSAPTNSPRAVLEASWNAALAYAGIEWVRGDAMYQSGGFTGLALAEVVSAPLDSIAAEVNARSMNLGAEALLHWAAGPVPDPARLLADHVRLITGDDTGLRLMDGSGLSFDDRASPHTFVTYMARFPATPAGRGFPMLFPANGTGTLRNLASGLPAPGVVRAKTGTLGNAATLVGYLGQQEGMLLVSVMYNGAQVSAAKNHQWQLFRVLGARGVIIPADEAVEVLGGEPPGPDGR